MPKRTVLVVGAGVNGLSCAKRLLEAGWAVRVVARERTPDTTSDVSAAIYFPYRADPPNRVAAWCRHSLRTFDELSLKPATGVRWIEMVELLVEDPQEPPWWGPLVRDLRTTAGPPHLPEYAAAWRAEVPLIPMNRYMPWLEDSVRGLGGTFESAALTHIDDVDHAHVVNCSGLGARELAGDEGLYPIRGQVVRVANPGVKKFWGDETGPRALTYVIPRDEDVILGGTAEDHDWRIEPDPDTEERILRRAIQLVPTLRGAEILGRAVGLRPGRREVRLEREIRRRSTVVHNYGHGGAGVTLSWGCAEEVLNLLD